MITVKGSVFGQVKVNSISLSFRDKDRKDSKKYYHGLTYKNTYFKKVNRKWKLDNIKQIIVKQYNYIRQAAEIYFDDSKSLFFSFFSEHYLNRFLKTLEESIKTKPRNIDIVRNPSQYFALKRFRERWVKSEISNFEYLMLLNKYGGRSFHDLNQYPVFPWVLSDYESATLNPSNKKCYRALDTPISSISAKKRNAKDNHASVVHLNELQVRKVKLDPYYLSYKSALTYLLRLEPYTSLLATMDYQQRPPCSTYHTLSEVWRSCNNNLDDNRELTPEFFYLPELFGNYNFCSFGVVNTASHNFRLNQVVLPMWATNNHHFVQVNALALENCNVSFSLHSWIDFMFGEKHQHPQFSNPLNITCDEEEILRGEEKNSNSMQLFTDKHPQKDKVEYEKKYSHALLAPENLELKRSLALLHVHTFKAGITQIYAYDMKVMIILSCQKLFKTHEEYLNVAHEKAIIFDKKDREVCLFPYKRMFIYGSSHLSCDARRSIISLDQGNYLITCRHYDNSCKIVSTVNGDVLQHLYFHKTIVFTIAATRDKTRFYSGSLDGVVAKWDISTYKTQPASTEWYVCDHKLAVITIDAEQSLDLVASGSLDGTIAIRVGTTGKLIRIIKPDLLIGESEYAINQIRLSYRGYILLLARCKYPKLELSDYFLVYSINGEEIARSTADDTINAIVLDETGYQFVAGGKCGRIYILDLLSLSSHDMLEELDEQLADIGKILHHFLSSSTAITALELTKQENYQQLLIGLSTGELYTLKYSPRVTSGKLFDNLQGLIISK